MKLYIFCDGGARGNPGPAAIGFLIKNDVGDVLIKRSKHIGKATNNQAEYLAVIEALTWISQNFKAKILSFNSINFYLDSQLVVNQLNGIFKIKNANLRNLIIRVKGLENQIKTLIYYHYIPRSKNYEADRLVNQALNKFKSTRPEKNL